MNRRREWQGSWKRYVEESRKILRRQKIKQEGRIEKEGIG